MEQHALILSHDSLIWQYISKRLANFLAAIKQKVNSVHFIPQLVG